MRNPLGSTRERKEAMDLDAVKDTIVTKVYHVTSETKVPLHKHDGKDEIFYCLKGSGFGVLEDSEVELSIGKEFIVKSGVMHSLRSDGDLYVASFLVPVVED
jgi:mannose-6-phosphate isomerase-like protein (cupin superfamily)